MQAKEAVMAGKAPRGLPFSPGIRLGQLVFVSGQGPLDSAGKVVQGDIRAQVRLTLENFQKVVEAAGSSMKNTLQATVFLKDLNDYAALNEVYSSFFPEPRPARAVVQSELLFGMKVEVLGIAFIPS